MAVVALGEVIDRMKKSIFYGETVDKEAMQDDIDRTMDFLRDLSADISNETLELADFEEMFQGSNGMFTPVGPEQLNQINTRILHVVMGVVTEGAEITHALTNSMEGEPLDMVNLSEEIGDLNWYANGIFPDASGVSYGKYLTANIVKLAVRYPEKFSSWLASEENRNLVEERKVLEAGNR
ncbi:hypothetical protein AGJ34_21480 [Cronobacter dublinensis subsp. dublinensis]|nr:hypothetical protein [Cronobacter dublinensis subsp. dublinensis]EGT5729692.1 hypothetical protein [Cronobacter dublinensis subsp. dublinensis]